MAQEAVFAAPRTEEITRAAVGMGAGVVTGLSQGVIAKFAPQFGAAAPFLTWGSLLITPLVGIAGALFTRGMISDVFMGVAAGSSGVLGFSVPGLMPEIGRRRVSGQNGGDQGGIKQLGAGAKYAPQRQQGAVRVGIEF
ncbi:hypothetical protein ES703_45308 [subsurface metagenome]